MTEFEKLLAGITSINDYDPDTDFDNDELEELIHAGILKASDLSQTSATELLIDGRIDYDSYPFEQFSPYEQIRQLQYCAIDPADFLKSADLKSFEADDWLYLLEVLPRLATEAPWDVLREKGSIHGWMDFLKSRPEYASYADWDRLAGKGKTEDFFDLFATHPAMYEHAANKQQLLEADSALWVKLLARRPEMAEIYPLDTLDEVDEIEFLLLHQPNLVNQISWDKENPPVKLYISNPAPELLKEIKLDMAWLISSEISGTLKPILQNALFYNADDARKKANVIGHSPETFAGIYSLRTAKRIMEAFRTSAAEHELNLQIRKEAVDAWN